MKTKHILATLTALSTLFFISMGHAQSTLIDAVTNGNWSDPNTWAGGVVPTVNSSVTNAANVESYNVTVDSTASCDYVVGNMVTMATNATLNIYGFTGGQGANGVESLVATAPGNTVFYSGNPYWAADTDYYNLVFCNTNYIDPDPPYYANQQFNNFAVNGPTPMTVTGNMTLIGYTDVQLGAPFVIGGNLVVGTNCFWDCSAGTLNVASNTIINGELFDGDGYTTNLVECFNNLTIGPTSPGIGWDYLYNPQTNGLWDLSDVIEWSIAGSLTNNGTINNAAIVPISGPSNGGAITFVGTGVIVGNPFQVSSLFLEGTNTIGTTITVTNFLGLSGTVVFDLANPQTLIVTTNSTNALTYGGALDVINSGPPPVSGTTYYLFSAPVYGGSFTSTNLPPLPGGLSWVVNLATNGSITVIGNAAGPIITSTHYNPATEQFTLTWTSGAGAMYTVQESPGLNPAAWSPLSINIPSGGSATTNTVTMPGGVKGFLRILVQ
jgi:hypothetical protein